MKKIAVVSIQKNYGEFLKKDLNEYFKNYATINSYSIEEMNYIDQFKENCIVISTYDIFQKVKDKVKANSKIIMCKLAIKNENLKKIKEIPEKSKILVVNIDYKQCMEIISLLYANGYKNYEYIPYFNLQNEYDPDIEYAVTPNEFDLTPKDIKNIINIGGRVNNFSTILEIAHVLELNNFTSNPKIKKLLHELETGEYGIEGILGEKDNLNVQINVLLEIMEQGIIITDISGIIISYNSKALHLLKDRTAFLEGANVSKIIPELYGIISSGFISKKEEKIIKINSKNIIITFISIIKDDINSGFVITLENFEEIEDKQNDIRTRISLGDHKANYTFNDIKGNSNTIRRIIKTAKMMANSNSSIVIYGESGTGKEVFAQSIHNESSRKKYNFVAVNCAAIPENLLESEMFGYEEGAFTGARKGGKIGYFELSHKGTLFLDEIAEMPLLMQSKILRAIEERQIIKVGSNKIISVDVRIIAATNKDLKEQIEVGKFREDLYYRLNVLQLNIPSLRERKEDIGVIANYFIESMGKTISFSNDAKKMMNSYSWKGNVRELRNVVEYIISLDKSIIDKEDLPFSNYQEHINIDTKTNRNINNDIIIKFILKEGNKIDLYKVILEELEKSYNKKERIGRIKLMNIFESYGLFYSEQEIRSCLIKLNNYGFINSMKGRIGSTITPIGVQLKNKIIELLDDIYIA